jgi:hypothetical protein
VGRDAEKATIMGYLSGISLPGVDSRQRPSEEQSRVLITRAQTMRRMCEFFGSTLSTPASRTKRVRRCQFIPGRCPFRNDDALTGFMGMAVRVRESWRCRGRRKPSGRSEPELRRLLSIASMRGRRISQCQPRYPALLKCGLCSTAALAAFRRKPARSCSVLPKKQAGFDPNFSSTGCATTRELSARVNVFSSCAIPARCP